MTSAALTLTLDQAIQDAIAHHQAGRLQEAEHLYRAILQAQPNHPDANHNLGVLAMQVWQPVAGLPHLKAALETTPEQGQYWISYINALLQSGQADAACAALAQGRERGLHGAAADALAERLAQSAPSQEELEQLIVLFNDRRYAEGAACAQALTARFPQHGFGWKVLGSALQKLGQLEQALSAMLQAVALLPADAEAHKGLGGILMVRGRLSEAEASYRRALEFKPDDAEVHSNLGAVLIEQDRFAEAEASCRRALESQPDLAEANNNLGTTLKKQGCLKEAEASYRRALEFKPEDAEIHSNLGAVLIEQDRLAEAEASCRRALELKPDLVEAYNNLGSTFKKQGRLKEAEASYRRALEFKPEDAEIHSNLGAVLIEQDRFVEAEASCRRALELNPNYTEAHSNLGAVLIEQGRFTEAEASYRWVLEFKPESAEAHSNLGILLKEQRLLAEAEASCRRALELKPDYAEAHSNLGSILREQGRLAEAEASCRAALVIKPDFLAARAHLLSSLNYTGSQLPQSCLDEARRYGALVEQRVEARFASWTHPIRPERLRVGLVSGDLRGHPVGYFLENVLAHLDSARIELIAYPANHKADAVTARIRSSCAAWKPIAGISDADAARLIHADRVQVLLDLSGHTADNRLPVFAWKPAPVQVTWLGYFATTGVAQMDYLLGDPFVTPPEEASHFSETIWRLPESYLCFTPPDVALQVQPLPALSGDGITFGSFNHLAKMNDAVVVLWAKVLLAVPGSRLLLKTPQLNDQALCAATRQRFATHGIDAGRVVLEGGSPRAELLAAYHRVDIALDPFPYPGGTTSVEALWMGVPVLTRRGDRFLSHVGESIAHNAGMADWIAVDDACYVAKAVQFAADRGRLVSLRSGLRQQVRASPLFDAARFARHFETALHAMWQRYTETTRTSV
jgi:protein O-GlcNAc transferase